MDITELSLCSGVGWLSLGVELAAEYLGWSYRCVGHCERDAYATSVLLERMEDASMGCAPVFAGNLEDLDADSLRGHASIITAGFPCQPWSAAGKQKGTADERWLWPAIANIIRRVGPRLVFLENVPGLVSGGGLEHVLSGLAEMRFNAEWLSVKAASVGASHKRERVFILAYRKSGGAAAAQFGRQRNGTERGNGDLAYSRCTPGHAEHGDESGEGLRRRAGSTDAERLGARSSQLAVPPLRRQRIVREPSGSDGQPDGSNEFVDNAPSTRPSRSGKRGIEIQATGDGEQAGVPGFDERCDSLGHTGSRGTSEPGEPCSRQPEQQPGWTSESGGRCSDVRPCRFCDYEFDHEQLGKYGRPNCEGDELAFPPESRQQGSGKPGLTRPHDGEPGRISGVPVFAPGPSSPHWRTIIAQSPHLSPAVESGFRVLVDGQPLLVDAMRADQLRCAGNGVVPAQAAAAFIELVRRAGLVERR